MFLLSKVQTNLVGGNASLTEIADRDRDHQGQASGLKPGQVLAWSRIPSMEAVFYERVVQGGFGL